MRLPFRFPVRRLPPLLLLAVFASAGAGCSLFGPRALRQADAFVEVRFLVPLEDNRGVAFDDSRFEWLEDRLAERFGGYTVEGVFPGAWHDGRRVVRETSRRYLVAVPEERVDELIGFLHDVKREFHQESLYVSVIRGAVMFL